MPLDLRRSRTLLSSMSMIEYRSSFTSARNTMTSSKAVDELRTEELLDLRHERGLDAIVVLHLVALAKTERLAALDEIGTDVRGHDEDRVSEVDMTAERIGQAAFLHDLQEHVEDIWVRLFNLRRAAPRHTAGGESVSVS